MFGLFRSHPVITSLNLTLTAPVQPVAQPPAWARALAPARVFASDAEGWSYARGLERAKVVAHERSGEAERDAEAEARRHVGSVMFNPWSARK